MSEFYSTACECVKYRWKDHSRCFDCETGNTGYFASFKTITTTLHGMTFNSVALETVKCSHAHSDFISTVIKIMDKLCVHYLRRVHLLCTL